MKKIIVLLLMILLCSSVFATNFCQVESLIHEKKVNFDLVNQGSVDLTAFDRACLIETSKRSGAFPLVINLFTGCGIGSFVQGDTFGGVMGLVLDVVGTSLSAWGSTQVMVKRSEKQYDHNGNVITYSSPSFTDYLPLIIGAGTLLGSRIFQIIRPLTYASSYNKKIKSALEGVAIVPVATKSGTGVSVVANVKL